MPKETGSLAWASDHPPTAEREAALLAATPDAMLVYQVVETRKAQHALELLRSFIVAVVLITDSLTYSIAFTRLRAGPG